MLIQRVPGDFSIAQIRIVAGDMDMTNDNHSLGVVKAIRNKYPVRNKLRYCPLSLPSAIRYHSLTRKKIYWNKFLDANCRQT